MIFQDDVVAFQFRFALATLQDSKSEPERIAQEHRESVERAQRAAKEYGSGAI